MQLPNNTEASMILHAWQDAGRPDLRLVEKPEFQTRPETFTLTRERVPGENVLRAVNRWLGKLIVVLFFATAAAAALHVWGVM